MREVIRFTEKDNVAVVLYDVKPKDVLHINGHEVTAIEQIPYGHKIALYDMCEGDKVYKYGESIAKCTKNIEKGAWVHVHNCESIRGLGR